MEDLGKTTTISWESDFKGEELAVSEWYSKNGWDFVGCVVDIQLKNKDGFFFVKYIGTVEGNEMDDIEEMCKVGDRNLYHFGVEKFSGRRMLFRACNIYAIRPHHSAKLEQEKTHQSIFGIDVEDAVITKDIVKELDDEMKADMEEVNVSVCA
tara:strand:+ start:114 stop:572 length:459 start_codon:yes stop_codon:yes gene_type:complete